MFTYVPPEYVIETINYWADSLMLDGFIIGNICEWYDTEKIYSLRTDEIIKFNSLCKMNGIKYNFLKIALGYREFPIWSDTLEVRKQSGNLAQIISWAKEVGFYGICFDTEPYTVPLWDPNSERFKGVALTDIKAGFNILSSTISQKIAYNGLELLIIPEGEYFYKNHNVSKYRLWEDFFSGLYNDDYIKKIIIGCEYTYKKVDYKTTKKFSDQLGKSKNNKVIFAFGAWPLGYYKSIKLPFFNKRIFINSKLSIMDNSYLDKSPNYYPSDFKNQLDNFHNFSNGWIWIYSHGSAWWSISDSSYSHIWRPDNQFIPTDENLKSYIKVLQNYKKENK
jgi:hypothetical protein